MRAPRITMYIGLPGSGKSTQRERFIAENPDALILSSDDVVTAYARENGITYSQAMALTDSATIHRLLYMLLDEAVKENRDILVDQVNMSKKRRHKFLCRVPGHYERIAVVFPIHRLVLARRLALREAKTGKRIPWYVVEQFRTTYDPPTDNLDLTLPHPKGARPEFTRIVTIQGEKPTWRELIRGLPYEVRAWWASRAEKRRSRKNRLASF
ncbi:MAG: ATP-binding protein [Verrucomicrobiaceae bacterium]|nr:MAG: ATP-binding protein [Verrucomicrobiaceae bacterium]